MGSISSMGILQELITMNIRSRIWSHIIYCRDCSLASYTGRITVAMAAFQLSATLPAYVWTDSSVRRAQLGSHEKGITGNGKQIVRSQAIAVTTCDVSMNSAFRRKKSGRRWAYSGRTDNSPFTTKIHDAHNTSRSFRSRSARDNCGRPEPRHWFRTSEFFHEYDQAGAQVWLPLKFSLFWFFLFWECEKGRRIIPALFQSLDSYPIAAC